jgi:hypothetical protein
MQPLYNAARAAHALRSDQKYWSPDPPGFILFVPLNVSFEIESIMTKSKQMKDVLETTLLEFNLHGRGPQIKTVYSQQPILNLNTGDQTKTDDQGRITASAWGLAPAQPQLVI